VTTRLAAALAALAALPATTTTQQVRLGCSAHTGCIDAGLLAAAQKLRVRTILPWNICHTRIFDQPASTVG
jgi:hypothetical protein